MNTFIYGTGNPAKLVHMKQMLAPLDVKIIGLQETGIAIPEADESGSTPLENARIKALTYYSVLKHPVFACDSGLYIDGLPDDEQPGVHVRRVNGKWLSDSEMVAHYAAVAKRLGGRAVARYRNAICLIMRDGEIYEYFAENIASNSFYIVDTPHEKRVEGFPLDCLSVDIQTGEYYYNTAESRSGDDSGQTNGFRAFFERVLENGGGNKPQTKEVPAMRKVLFDRRSPCLQPVLDAICRHNHRTLVLWALEYAQELTCRFEERYAQETRPRAALEAARAWSRGAIKMPQAQQAILAAHRAAAELEDDRVYCALAHAVGQAVSTVHVETHAIGGPMYALTALALTGGQEAVQAECTHICERLAFWENADTGGQPWAAFLLREKPNKEQLLRDREREQ